MPRVVTILTIAAWFFSSVSCGQGLYVPPFDQSSVTRSEASAWPDKPWSSNDHAFNDAMSLDGQFEQLDWLGIHQRTAVIRYGDLLVRGQSDEEDASGEGESSGGGGDLTAQSNDPTAALISVNMQNFFQVESYEASGFGYQLGFLPVIPIQKSLLGFDRMIARPSVPIFAPTVDPDGPAGSASGMGDIFLTHIFVKEASWGTWGVGPAINFPTATDPQLGSREWQLGPSAVVIGKSENKKWMYGGLVLAPFSLQSELKSISFQPILVRFLPNDFYIGNGFQVWNFQTNSGNFVMPLTLKVGRVFKKAKPHPLNLSLQASYTPDDWHQGPAPKWQFLFTYTVLLPGG